MTERGIVMSVGAKHVVVMLPGGEFRRVRWSGGVVRIGQKIDVPESPSYSLYRWVSVPALTAALGAVYLFGVAPAVNAAAVISVDINPSINLEISGRGRVMDVVGLDSAGRRLANQKRLIGLHPAAAVTVIMREARQDGYLHQSSDVVIGAVFATRRQPWFGAVSRAAATVLQEAHIHASVVTVSGVSPSILKTMEKPTVSVGRYLLWDRASHGTQRALSANQVRTMPVVRLLAHTLGKHSPVSPVGVKQSAPASASRVVPISESANPPSSSSTFHLPSLPVSEPVIISTPVSSRHAGHGNGRGQSQAHSRGTPPSGGSTPPSQIVVSPTPGTSAGRGSGHNGRHQGHGSHAQRSGAPDSGVPPSASVSASVSVSVPSNLAPRHQRGQDHGSNSGRLSPSQSSGNSPSASDN